MQGQVCWYLCTLQPWSYLLSLYNWKTNACPCILTGVGMLIFAPLSTALLSVYDWRNALRLLVCVTLQAVVAGALLRPLTAKPCTNNSSLQDSESTVEEVGQSAQDMNKRPEDLHNNRDLEIGKEEQNESHIQRQTMVSLTHEQETEQFQNKKNDNDKFHCSGNNFCASTNDISQSVCNHGNRDLRSHYQQREHLLTKTCDNLNALSIPDKSDLSRNCRSYDHIPQKSVQKCKNVRHIKDNEPRHTTYQASFKPLLRKDVFYSGSLARLPEYRSHPSVYQKKVTSDTMQNLTEVSPSDERSCSCFQHHNLYLLRKMLDVSVVTDGYFLVISACNMLMQMGYFIPILFVSEYAKHIHISPTAAASLISLFGE